MKDNNFWQNRTGAIIAGVGLVNILRQDNIGDGIPSSGGSGIASLGVGDSVQVIVTGITSSSVIVATFDENSAPSSSVGALTIANKQTDKFTIKATAGNGLKVQYWIGKK